jgi:hypothetical protein
LPDRADDRVTISANRADPAAAPRYPENHLVALLDDDAQVGRTVAALTSGGFLPEEIQVACGAEAGARLRATSGRTGLTGLLVHIAERLGFKDDEMEVKDVYEKALHNGQFLLAIAVPTQLRRERAEQILRDADAHGIAHLGKFTVERLVPPR